MKRNSKEQYLLREYLLGNLKEQSSRRQIEERIMLDADFECELEVAEDDLIEDYLDDLLSSAQRDQFHTHFLASPERRANIELIKALKIHAVQTKNERAQPKKVHFGWRDLFAVPALRFGLVLLFAGCLGVSAWYFVWYKTDVDRGLAQMRIAYQGRRITEGRLSGPFDYAAQITTRGANGTSVTDETAHRRAERYLFDASENSADAKTSHALGLLFLADKKLDPAIDQFNAALKSDPQNATLHSDLGVALLEKSTQSELAGTLDESLKDRALSLQSFNQALTINPALQEALFNRALILQKMRISGEARLAWEQYLKTDSQSPWADEARANLERLTSESSAAPNKTQIRQDFLDAYRRQDAASAWRIASQTKELITDAMLAPQLAEQYLESDLQNRKPEAGEILTAFIYLGEIERKNSGDLFFIELSNYYKSVPPAEKEKLAGAQAGMRRGYEFLLKSEWSSALQKFSEAQKSFAAAGDFWEAEIAEYQIAYTLCQLKDIAESNRRLQALSARSEQRKHKWLRTLADGWMGSNYALLGEHSKSLYYGRRALAGAEEISDVYNIQKTLNQLAHEYWLLGDTRRTLEAIYRTRLFTDLYYSSPRQTSRNLLIAMGGLSRFGFYELAAAFGREQIRLVPDELREDWLTQSGHTQLALIYAEAGKLDEAFNEIDESFKLANSFSSETMRSKQTARTQLTLAQLQQRAGNCAGALENYSKAFSVYADNLNEYEARKGKLTCLIAMKNEAAIKAELPLLFNLFDKNRRTIIEQSSRLTFFNEAQEAYDLAVDYAYTSENNAAQSFAYAEDSRARALLDMIEPTASRTTGLSELQNEMPPGIQIVYYAALDDKLLIWHVSKSNIQTVQVPVGEKVLREKIEQYRELLTRQADSQSAAEDLYNVLIKPIENFLEPGDLCLIPDKAIFRVPFGALKAPQSDKYLIESHALLVAPSATVFLEETANAAQKKSVVREKLLSVGNPAFQQAEYSELADLPEAAREAREVAAYYDDNADVLVNNEANIKSFTAGLSSADVVHFAGHYVTNPKYPERSKLMLSSGDLTIEDIMREKLSRTRLLILSACETGVESYYHGEGMIGGARAFLAAGVPLVIASQWAVDSAAARELMVKFHRLRKQQSIPAQAALRQAQIAMIQHNNPQFRAPYYWSGFMPIGGYANY